MSPHHFIYDMYDYERLHQCLSKGFIPIPEYILFTHIPNLFSILYE